MIVVLVIFGILEIYLHFMESVISYSSSMDNVSSLCEGDLRWVIFIVILTYIILDDWENWIWLANDLTGEEFSTFTNLVKSPVKVATFPEFSEIDGNFFAVVC